ncbi:unnamed protein product [Cylindrotheca closterium]|uniref:Uncharacterized protein n=1 Tax=Cylindrotheca closterium TaxID=2856 RepID=A0AAD2CUU4_9STRA|nr:unnamed protein product [Cylindrotheca closterium]
MEQSSGKRSRPPSPYPQDEARKSPSKNGNRKPKKKRALAGAVVVEEETNRRLRVHRAQTMEHKRLKAEVDALSKCNLEKVEEMASLKTNISSLKEKIGAVNEEIALLSQNTTTTLPTDLAAAEQRMHNVHDSWREQVTQLGEKQSQAYSSRYELQQVQEGFQKDTQHLIQELQERKQSQERLDKLQEVYTSQGKAAQWHNIMRGSATIAVPHPTAIKEDYGGRQSKGL